MFTHNIGQIAPKAIVIPLLIGVSFSSLFLLMLSVFLKNSHKAGIIVSLFLLLFFSYGHFNRNLLSISILWSVIFLAGVWLTIKTKNRIIPLTLFLNIVASILVGIPLVQIGAYELGSYQYKIEHTVQTDVNLATNGTQKTDAPQSLPNIFFIILDAYAREDVLEELYGYNNAEFLNFLESRGFYIADQSMSNYCQTSLTVASCLNMKYLNDLVGKYLRPDSNAKQPLWKAIRKSKVFYLLKQKGYKIAAFSSGIEETEIRNADIYIQPGLVLEPFESALLNTTPVPALLDLFPASSLFDLHRDRISYTLDHLPDLCSTSPVFIFAHLVVPHPPYVFGPNGEKRSPTWDFDHHDADWLISNDRLTIDQYKKAYVDQLIYTNKRVTAVIDSILSRSENPPIILLFGDHGPRSMTQWENPDSTYMKECLTNLNAYHLPKTRQSSLLYSQISPVNTFRVIFNQYFGRMACFTAY